jgi:hypothetical protein
MVGLSSRLVCGRPQGTVRLRWHRSASFPQKCLRFCYPASSVDASRLRRTRSLRCDDVWHLASRPGEPILTGVFQRARTGVPIRSDGRRRPVETTRVERTLGWEGLECRLVTLAV